MGNFCDFEVTGIEMSLILRSGMLALLVCFGAPADAANSFYKSRSMDVVAGQHTYIYKNDELSKRCVVSHLAAKVETYPKHGTLVVSHGPVKNSYKRPLAQAKCPYMVDDGVNAYYQSAAGYRGKDKVVISVTDKAENTEYTTIYLNVK